MPCAVGPVWDQMRTEILGHRGEVIQRLQGKETDSDEDVRSSATIAFRLVSGADVSLRLYDSSGRLAHTL